VWWPADTSYAKALDLLVTLVRRSGHLVSKDDLLRAVWPDTIVEEVNLTVNISALRKALGRGFSAHYISLANVDNGCWPWIEAVLSD
jgi:DNA-binding winged helix-turn-helix (wHTH) protein